MLKTSKDLMDDIAKEHLVIATRGIGNTLHAALIDTVSIGIQLHHLNPVEAESNTVLLCHDRAVQLRDWLTEQIEKM